MTGVVFFSCFIIGCCLAFIRHPIFGLLTYVATYYLHPPSRWWGSTLPDIRWSLVAALATGIAIIINKKKPEQSRVKEKRSIIFGYSLFCFWLIIQYSWSLAPETHSELIFLYIKYSALIWIITTTVDSEKHLHWFCWAHILGCTYLGWIAYSEYDGGRFESFGGSDINEANAGALQMVSAILISASIFLIARFKEKREFFL